MLTARIILFFLTLSLVGIAGPAAVGQFSDAPAASEAEKSVDTTQQRERPSFRRDARSKQSNDRKDTGPRDRRRASKHHSPALSPKQLRDLIAVANDFNPRWGESLKKAYRQNPDLLRKAVQRNGSRLMSLAVLREKNPELYELNVEKLRLESETKQLAVKHNAAKRRGDSSRVAEIEAEMEQLVTRLVDLDLKARAQELLALDTKLRKLKDQLQQDTAERDDTIQRRLRTLTGANTSDRSTDLVESPRNRDDNLDGDFRPTSERE